MSIFNDNDNDMRLGLTAKADQPDHKKIQYTNNYKNWQRSSAKVTHKLSQICVYCIRKITVLLVRSVTRAGKLQQPFRTSVNGCTLSLSCISIYEFAVSEINWFDRIWFEWLYLDDAASACRTWASRLRPASTDHTNKQTYNTHQSCFVWFVIYLHMLSPPPPKSDAILHSVNVPLLHNGTLITGYLIGRVI